MTRSATVLGLIILTALAVAALTVISAPYPAKAQTPLMKVVPASQSLDIEDGNFSVDIYVENVANFGAFEFTLSFNPDIIRLVGVAESPFLGSTGRVIYCPRPIRYEPAPSGAGEAVRFGCTSSDHGIPGPNGSGKVAAVTFAPRAAGTSPLNLGLGGELYGITDIMGGDVYIAAQGGRVEIVGSGPAPTPQSDEPTPIPVEPPPSAVTPLATRAPGAMSWLTPQPGETPLARPLSSDRAATGDAADGRLAGAAGDDAANISEASRAGTGPIENERRWQPLAVVQSVALIGIFLLLTGSSVLWFQAKSRESGE